MLTGEKPKSLQLALPVLNPAPTPDPQVIALSKLPRKRLAARLMEIDPRLTDKRILEHLPKLKLGRMLFEREAAAVEAERRMA